MPSRRIDENVIEMQRCIILPGGKAPNGVIIAMNVNDDDIRNAGPE